MCVCVCVCVCVCGVHVCACACLRAFLKGERGRAKCGYIHKVHVHNV